MRIASVDDIDLVVPRARQFNAHEQIVVEESAYRTGLENLLRDPSLGVVWLIGEVETIGYAIITYGYDLEFAGRDAFLTEFWIDEGHRGGGTGRAALAHMEAHLRSIDCRALHLQVRTDNPDAQRLYERAGFVVSPRRVMTLVLLVLALAGCQKDKQPVPTCTQVTNNLIAVFQSGSAMDILTCEARKLTDDEKRCLYAAKSKEAIASCHAGRE